MSYTHSSSFLFPLSTKKNIYIKRTQRNNIFFLYVVYKTYFILYTTRHNISTIEINFLTKGAFRMKIENGKVKQKKKFNHYYSW